MSFLDIRGEIIYCEKCGAKHKIKYIGGKRSTQIGDFEVMHQKELSKQLMSNYDAETNGYYYHRFALCDKCLKTLENVIILNSDHLLIKYYDNLELLSDLINTLEASVEDNFREKFNKNKLHEINPEAFESLRNSKHHGLKKEKRRFSETYVISIIYPYLNTQVKSNPKFQILKKTIIDMEKKLIHFAEQWNSSTQYYGEISLNNTRNLNQYISTPLSTRTPSFNVSCKKFYQKIELSKSDMLECIDDTDKFSCRFDEPWLSGYFKNLPSKLAAMDFWN